MSGARLGPIKVVAYDPDWPDLYAAERSALLRLGGAALLTLEHIGSTAVPGLPAKPVIDMMAAVAGFDDARVLAYGYAFEQASHARRAPALPPG